MEISDDGKLTFKLPTFEGPLDLLLHLIKKNEMDIYDIPMSKITSQYIDYLHQMQSLELDIAGEYLVIAAMLVNIKSKMLLPSTNAETMIDDEDVIDPREELVAQLVLHQPFHQFKHRHENRYHKFHFGIFWKKILKNDRFLVFPDLFFKNLDFVL